MTYTIGIDLTFIKDHKKAVGNEISALSIVEGLHNNRGGQDFIIFANQDNAKDLKNMYKSFNVISTTKGFAFYNRFLPKFVKKYGVDVLYYPQYVHFMNFRLKTKIVITTHGLIKGDDFLLDKLRPAMIKRAAKVVAASDFLKNELIKKRSIDPSKIITIPNPLANMTKSVDVVFKKKNILAVGSDKPQKNIMLVVRAFEKLVPIIEHDLILIGDISGKGEIFRYIVDNNISNRIIVTGRVSRETLFGYYKNTDLFVNTSTYEGFGLAPLEAMAFKAPVVSTPIPSISELGNVQFDAALNYEDDEREVANKMLAVLKSEKNTEYLENRAKRILDYYSLDSISKKYLQVFENV